jgi:hypothetical protein
LQLLALFIREFGQVGQSTEVEAAISKVLFPEHCRVTFMLLEALDRLIGIEVHPMGG